MIFFLEASDEEFIGRVLAKTHENWFPEHHQSLSLTTSSWGRIAVPIQKFLAFGGIAEGQSSAAALPQLPALIGLNGKLM